MGKYVSDVVWQQLDPHAGRLSRRTVAQLWAASALAVLVIAAAIAGWHTGLLVPHLRSTGASSAEVPIGGPITTSIEFRNSGVRPVTILAAGRSEPGLELLGNGNTLPMTVGPGETFTLTFVYRITDCDAVPTGAWELPVRVQRLWGEQTISVRDWTGDWPRTWLDLWCNSPR